MQEECRRRSAAMTAQNSKQHMYNDNACPSTCCECHGIRSRVLTSVSRLSVALRIDQLLYALLTATAQLHGCQWCVVSTMCGGMQHLLHCYALPSCSEVIQHSNALQATHTTDDNCQALPMHV
jgi:hypothetical protein